jgi:integrase/recombinase XerD
MGKSLLVFEKYVKSQATKQMYQYQFNRFLKWTKINDADGLLQLKESYLQNMVEEYILFLRNTISPNSFHTVIASLDLFFSMNDKNLNWKRIRKMIPASVKKSGYAAWQTEDIQTMLKNTTSLRNKTLVHFLASTGCRVGAIPDLKIKHLSEMSDNCQAILFYEGSNEEYYGFLTPEASKILQEYLEERRKDGENLDDNSPLFRESYQTGVQKVKSISLGAISQILHRLVKKTRTRKRVGRRFNIMILHGFRKRFGTIIKLDNKIGWAVSERLLGHQSYLDPEYFVPTKDKLFNEFKKVIPDLTIGDSERQRIVIENQQKKLEEKEQLKLELGNMKDQYAYMKDIFGPVLESDYLREQYKRFINQQIDAMKTTEVYRNDFSKMAQEVVVQLRRRADEKKPNSN